MYDDGDNYGDDSDRNEGDADDERISNCDDISDEENGQCTDVIAKGGAAR